MALPLDRVNGAGPSGGLARQLRDHAPVPPRVLVAQRTRLLSIGVIVADLVAVVAAYAVAHPLRTVSHASGQVLTPETAGKALYLTVPIWLVVLAGYGLYDRRHLVSASQEARRLLQAAALSVMGVMLVTFFFRVQVARAWIVALWVSGTVLLSAERLLARRVVHLLRRSNVIAVQTLIVGANGEARAIARSLGRQRWLGYRVAGFVEVDAPTSSHVDGLPVVGAVDTVVDAVVRMDAGLVIVAGTAVTSDDLQAVDRALRSLDVEVRVSPGLPHVAASRMAVEPIDGLALLSLRRNGVTWRGALAKRAFDLVGAAALLLVVAPVLAVTAIAVKVTSPGPVLFRQARAGKEGRPFVIFKFRTMVADAEARLHALGLANQADGILFKMRDDPRVTRVGRFLRRWAVDELPQLFNVVKGEMSLVGPRPALLAETEKYDDLVRPRLDVKPGLTGLWQVNGRHDIPFDDYIRYDLFYVENWSLALDLYVLAKTLPVLVSRRGAY